MNTIRTQVFAATLISHSLCSPARCEPLPATSVDQDRRISRLIP